LSLDLSANKVIALFGGAVSGVSTSALSAGDDSAPEASEKRSASNGLRGVVKDGLRNGAAVAAEAPPNLELEFKGVFVSFTGDSKPPGEELVW
jgi:hypothetical protein